MKILAFEFSSDCCSVAALEAGSDGPPVLWGEAVATERRVENALGLVERVLTEARWEREAIELLAIGLGPGSYTGIRAAIALGQGWQLARPIRLVGISSVECLAAQAQALGWTGMVTILIDAQRREFYCARYEIQALERRVITPLRLIPEAEALALAQSGERVTGPEVAQWFAGGSVLCPRAWMVGRLAAGGADVVPVEKLEPIYLRPISFIKAPPPRVRPEE